MRWFTFCQRHTFLFHYRMNVFVRWRGNLWSLWRHLFLDNRLWDLRMTPTRKPKKRGSFRILMITNPSDRPNARSYHLQLSTFRLVARPSNFQSKSSRSENFPVLITSKVLPSRHLFGPCQAVLRPTDPCPTHKWHCRRFAAKASVFFPHLYYSCTTIILYFLRHLKHAQSVLSTETESQAWYVRRARS